MAPASHRRTTLATDHEPHTKPPRQGLGPNVIGSVTTHVTYQMLTPASNGGAPNNVGTRSKGSDGRVVGSLPTPVNVPVSRAYNQWTQFEDFPQFMGGVQKVTQLSDDRLEWWLRSSVSSASGRPRSSSCVPTRGGLGGDVGRHERRGRVFRGP
jgi:Polyketide cyclase / dehydrase and lipid transport